MTLLYLSAKYRHKSLSKDFVSEAAHPPSMVHFIPEMCFIWTILIDIFLMDNHKKKKKKKNLYHEGRQGNRNNNFLYDASEWSNFGEV